MDSNSGPYANTGGIRNTGPQISASSTAHLNTASSQNTLSILPPPPKALIRLRTGIIWVIFTHSGNIRGNFGLENAAEECGKETLYLPADEQGNVH